MNYAIYDKSSGRIDRVISCPEEFLAANYGDNEGCLPCAYETDATHYVLEGALAPFPARPSEFHTWDWHMMQWQADVPSAWAFIRKRRNQLLERTDWTQLPDVPAATASSYRSYRQALRDITAQADPLNIIWPAMPAN